MDLLYSFNDYEEHYYHMRWYECKKVGCYLLERLKDKRSKELLKRLQKFEYDWLHPIESKDDILTEVKVWLMVNQNWL